VLDGFSFTPEPCARGAYGVVIEVADERLCLAASMRPRRKRKVVAVPRIRDWTSAPVSLAQTELFEEEFSFARLIDLSTFNRRHIIRRIICFSRPVVTGPT